MLPTMRPRTQTPRPVRSTWRSLDPNGDTSSNGCSQLQPGERYRAVVVFRQAGETGSPAGRPRCTARPPTSGGRWRGRCATRRRTRDRSAGVVTTSSPRRTPKRRNRVDLIDRLLQPLLQILAQARRLRPERRRDQPLLGFGGVCEQRRVHRDRRRQEREEEYGEPRGLRDAVQASRHARRARARSGAGDERKTTSGASGNGRRGLAHDRAATTAPPPAACGGASAGPARRWRTRRRAGG